MDPEQRDLKRSDPLRALRWTGALPEVWEEASRRITAVSLKCRLGRAEVGRLLDAQQAADSAQNLQRQEQTLTTKTGGSLSASTLRRPSHHRVPLPGRRRFLLLRTVARVHLPEAQDVGQPARDIPKVSVGSASFSGMSERRKVSTPCPWWSPGRRGCSSRRRPACRAAAPHSRSSRRLWPCGAGSCASRPPPAETPAQVQGPRSTAVQLHASSERAHLCVRP